MKEITGAGRETARRAGGEAAVGGAKPRQARPEGGLPCGPPIPHRPEKAEKSGALFWKTPELFLFDIEGAALLLFHVTDDGGAGDLIALL